MFNEEAAAAQAWLIANRQELAKELGETFVVVHDSEVLFKSNDVAECQQYAEEHGLYGKVAIDSTVDIADPVDFIPTTGTTSPVVPHIQVGKYTFSTFPEYIPAPK